MVATVDFTTDETVKSHTAGARNVFMLENTIDCADDNQGAGDTAQMLDIYAGWFVEKVFIEVETAEGGTLTIDVGDGSDTDGFLDGTDGNVAAQSISTLALTEAAPNTVTGYSNGKLYTADDTIDILFNDAADLAKITIKALVYDFS